MGQTPIYQLPYPDPRLPLPYATPTSTPDVPTDVKQLADRLELVLPTSGPTRPAVSYGTSPPASPADGDLWYYPADATNGIMWCFRYRSGSASTYKWEFVGGSEITTTVATQETTSTTGYGNLTTVGPQLTVPRAGHHFVRWGATIESASQNRAYAALEFPGTAAVDANAATVASGNPAAQAQGGSVYREGGPLLLAASDTVILKYRVAIAAAVSFEKRWLTIRPIRIS